MTTNPAPPVVSDEMVERAANVLLARDYTRPFLDDLRAALTAALSSTAPATEAQPKEEGAREARIKEVVAAECLGGGIIHDQATFAAVRKFTDRILAAAKEVK